MKPESPNTKLEGLWRGKYYPFPLIPSPDPFPKGGGATQINSTLRIHIIHKMQNDKLHKYHTGDKKYQLLHKESVRMKTKPTKYEDILWQKLKGNKIGYHFRRQHIINNFIVDFVCLTKMFIVEADGEIHISQIERDKERDNILYSLGYKILRFKNEELENNLESVLEKIKLEIECIPPLPLGKGSGDGMN